MFDSLWNSFELRFDAILSSLSRHRDLIDHEAASFDIVQASENRRKINQELEKSEEERSDSHLLATLSWLGVEDRLQEDNLSRLNDRRFPDTCQWLLKTPQYQSWLVDNKKHSILWLWGIPGSGKFLLIFQKFISSAKFY